MPGNLLEVPRAQGGTGKEDFTVIKITLEERMVEGVKVVGLVFDTPSPTWARVRGCAGTSSLGVHITDCGYILNSTVVYSTLLYTTLQGGSPLTN